MGKDRKPDFCGRTRRQFLWEMGGGFVGTALAGLLDAELAISAQSRP